MWRKILLWASVGLAIAFLVIACSQSRPTKPEIRIGLAATFTDKVEAATGKPTVQGAKLAIQQLEEEGGLKINGVPHKIVLIVEDDEDNPEVAIAAATSLINKEKVVAIVGFPRSRSAIYAADVAERYGIPMVSSKSTNPQTTANKKYVFRVAYTDDFQGKIIAEFALRELGVKKAAVLYDVANDYSRELAKIFRESFASLGGEVVAFEPYTTDQQDFRDGLENIRQSQAELLFLPNYAEEVFEQVKQIRDLDLKVTLIGGDSWGSMMKENFSILEGGFFADIWNSHLPNPATKDFVNRYLQAYKEEPNAHAALTYDAINLVFEAIKSQGTAEPESIREGLDNINNYRGVSGTISYRGTGEPIKSVVFLEIQGGKPVFYKSLPRD